MISGTLPNTLVKIRFVDYGYLPDYPYHLISISEMCDAFLADDGTGYFFDYYPLLDDSLHDEYTELVAGIRYHLNAAKTSQAEDPQLPDWIYSYMLGHVISSHSDTLDLHGLLEPLGVDNLDDVFTAAAQARCLAVSKTWLAKIPPSKLDHRPPTLFGEPHVLKYIRLAEIDPAGLVI